MADEKKDKDKPENESELLTMHHIISDGKASPGGEEGAEVFGFEPQPLDGVAVEQDKEKESGQKDLKEENADKSQSANHHLITDGWSAK